VAERTAGRGPVRAEPSGKRVRVFLGGRLLVDSDDASYVWDIPHYPQYYLPLAHVRAGALEATGTVVEDPGWGEATVYTVRCGGREVAAGAVGYPGGPPSARRDRVRFRFDAMDAWFEEDEEIFGHPRDPGTRVQILASSRSVTVELDGTVIASSSRPTLVYETGLPRRTYFPKLDVRMDLLEPTATTSRCPYKGTARYWTVRTAAGVHPDVAWSYPAPVAESAPIAGLVAFYDERVGLRTEPVLPPLEGPR